MANALLPETFIRQLTILQCRNTFSRKKLKCWYVRQMKFLLCHVINKLICKCFYIHIFVKSRIVFMVWIKSMKWNWMLHRLSFECMVLSAMLLSSQLWLFRMKRIFHVGINALFNVWETILLTEIFMYRSCVCGFRINPIVLSR